jgi:hypothetical protein
MGIPHTYYVGNPDPQQRVFGLGLLVISALALILVLAAKIGC